MTIDGVRQPPSGRGPGLKEEANVVRKGPDAVRSAPSHPGHRTKHRLDEWQRIHHQAVTANKKTTHGGAQDAASWPSLVGRLARHPVKPTERRRARWLG